MARRFYAFATGQNHANLPPVLTLAEPSAGDTVVWLETETAARAGWARNSNTVLTARGLRCETLPIAEEDVYAPNRLRGTLEADIAEHSTDQPFFVITGGQKHSVLGFDRAAQRCRVPLVYSDIAPAQLRVLEPDGEIFESRHLSNCLSLPEFLAARGLQLIRAGELRDEDDSSYAGFRQYSNLQGQIARLDSAGDEKVAFGRWFEGAVARRVLQLLIAKLELRGGPGACGPVWEVWFDVKVGPNLKSVFAEYDVLILLANAAVLHLECKTGRAEEKDSYARIAKLDLIGGPGASQLICRPMFTNPKLPARFLESTDAQRRNAEKWHMQFIGYTADGQPEEYTFRGERHAAPPFEETLERLLRRYSPASSSTAGA